MWPTNSWFKCVNNSYIFTIISSKKFFGKILNCKSTKVKNKIIKIELQMFKFTNKIPVNIIKSSIVPWSIACYALCIIDGIKFSIIYQPCLQINPFNLPHVLKCKRSRLDKNVIGISQPTGAHTKSVHCNIMNLAKLWTFLWRLT